jgi:sigma-B regulation protein RsbU (phosphoserine phosphatase)
MSGGRRPDLQHAQEIQRSFLPVLPEQVPGFCIATEYRPMFAIGGDFYDIVVGPDRRLLVAVGDVSGKGVSGALWMARATLQLAHAMRTERQPAAVLRALEAAFGRSLLDGSAGADSVAIVCASIDLEDGIMRIANAGHMPPLLRREGVVREVGMPSAPPIGLLPLQNLVEESHAVGPGDLVLLATDGVTDGLRTAGDPLGVAALRQLAGGNDNPFQKRRRLRRALRRKVDDATFLAIQAVEI